ncbi:MAG: P-loop NTPase [Candidatus Aenigmatarchaeota archaeon]
MVRIIGIVSGKGGTGKTLIATNLSYAISNLGFKTLLIDFNFTTPHIPIILNSKPSFTLNDFLEERADFYEILNPHLNFFFVSPSTSLQDLKNFKIENIEKLKEKLSYFDYVIIDSAPGFGREATYSFLFSDEILIIANPNLSSLFDSLKCYELAKRLDKKVLGILINRYTKDSALTIQDFKNVFEIPILGIIEESKIAKQLDLKRKMLYDLDKNFQNQILEVAYKICNLEIKKESFLEKIRRFFKII